MNKPGLRIQSDVLGRDVLEAADERAMEEVRY